jgi:peptide/nickel transport system substrate-binding protein
MTGRGFASVSGVVSMLHAGGRRRVVLMLSAGLLVLPIVLGGWGGGGRGPASATAAPQRGGTLRLLGTSDIFNLDTVSGYYTVLYIISRAFTRQLVSYSTSPDFRKEILIAPDIATALPTRANGGISGGGKTYTFHLKRGVKWDTSPPRQVTAGDFVREFKLLCNPASPTGAPGYFTSTIAGMKAYCDGFAKVKGTAPAIARYAASHRVRGVIAKGDLTLVLHLNKPAPDFLNILALPFSSARPVEYMKYVPDSAQFRQHTISDGPYKIVKYEPTKGFQLERNPAWDPKTDSLRKAYVDRITVTEGLTADNVQQQLEAGTAEMEWDATPPTQDLPRLISSHDKRLLIAPAGPFYVALNVYLALNQYAGPMKNKLVRQAVNYAVDKNAIVQIYGGKRIAATTNQVILPGSVGYIPNFNPYPDKNGSGDPAKARKILAQAGYPNGLDIKLLYNLLEPGPRIAQSLQASLERAAFRVKLIPATGSDFYGKYMYVPSTAKQGAWDIAPPGWIPDWFGNNGRSVIQPLFTSPAPGSSDFGGYSSAVTNGLVDKALTATSQAQAATYWRQANAQLMKDAATVPVEVQKWTVFHSSKVQNCVFYFLSLNCDVTKVWLKG